MIFRQFFSVLCLICQLSVSGGSEFCDETDEAKKCIEEVRECYSCRFGRFPHFEEDDYDIEFQFFAYSEARESRVRYSFEYKNHRTAIPRLKFPIMNEFWVIIHGFEDEWPLPWMDEMRRALLDVDASVLIVRWPKALFYPLDYNQACANTPVVGKMVAIVLERFQAVHKLDPINISLAGFSLGSVISGHIGRIRNGNIRLIIGMDPPGPNHENEDTWYRLDASDAETVQAIHTNGAMFGTMRRVGDIDIYANGGMNQPGCPLAERSRTSFSDWYSFANLIGCSHLRAPALFTDSIRNANCDYVAYPCSSTEDWEWGRCFEDCFGGGDCVFLGYQMDPHKKSSGSYHLGTITDEGLNVADKTYCGEKFWVRIIPDREVYGEVRIAFNTKKQPRNPVSEPIQKFDVKMYEGLGRTRVISAEGSPVSVTITYRRYSAFFQSGGTVEWKIKSLRVVREDGTSLLYKGNGRVASGEPATFTLKASTKINYKQKIKEMKKKLKRRRQSQ